MHEHAQLITRFYDAFASGDAETMVSCYHQNVSFSDPVFTDLRGEHAGNMWRMLCARATDLVVEASAIEANDEAGKAHWDATYTFAETGRKVINRIDARFKFSDGLIIEHRDVFDLWKWTRMALGPIGLVLGWTPIVTGKVRQQAATALQRWEQKSREAVNPTL